jgi:CRP-like cAMP-binding protein
MSELDSPQERLARARQLMAASRFADALDQVASLADSDAGAAELAAISSALLGRAESSQHWEQLRNLVADSSGSTRARVAALEYAFAGRDIERSGIRAAAVTDEDTTGWPSLCVALCATIDGNWPAALAAATQARICAESRGDDQLAARACNIVGISLGYASEHDSAVEALRDGVRFATASGDADAELRTRVNLVETLAEGPDLVAAIAAAHAAADAADLRGLPGWRTETHAALAFLLAQSGDLHRAVLEARTALSEPAAFHDDYVAVHAAEVLLDAGIADATVEQLIDGACTRSRESGFASLIFQAEATRVQLVALRDGLDEAVALAEGLHVDEPQSMLRLALLACRLGVVLDHDGARALAAGHAHQFSTPPNPLSALCVEEIEATLAAWTNPEGIERLATAAQAWQTSGRVLDAHRARISQAACLVAHDRSGEAGSLLGALHHDLIACGALGEAAAVARLLDDMAGGAVTAALQPRSSLFDCAPDDERDSLLALGTIRSVSTGHQFHDVGERCETLWTLRTGAVRLYRSAPDGREIAVDILGPGGTFGHLSLESATPTTLAAEATADCEVWQIQLSALREAVRRWPGIGDALMEVLDRRVAAAHEIVAEFAFLSVEERLARLILRLDERFGHPRLDGSRIVNIPLTHEQIARMIGTRRKRITAALGGLRDQGAIDTDRKRIVIVNRAPIETMANSS